MNSVFLGGPGSQLSGTEIIEDLASCLVEAMSAGPELRATDAYRGYAATLTITVQLDTLDPVTVDKTVTIGDYVSSRPADLGIEIESPLAGAAEVRSRLEITAPSLEHSTTVTEEPEPQPPQERRRWYTPRKTVKARAHEF